VNYQLTNLTLNKRPLLPFQEKNDYFKQLLLISILCLLGVLLLSLLGAGIAYFLFDVELNNQFSYTNLSSDEMNALKMIQFFSAMGLFILPTFIHAKLLHNQPFVELGLKTTNIKNFIVVLLIMVSVAPFLSYTITINEALVLPEFMSGIEAWMKQSEEQAMQLTTTFLTMNSVVEFIFVFIIVALLPAFGEELLFRGVLQKLLVRWIGKPHLAIWLTAIIFSALHMQFFGFLPRMLLGVLFGYLFFWSKSLWLPIFAHLLNNGSVVVVGYLYPETIKQSEIVTFTDDALTKISLAILSLVITIGLLFYLKKQYTSTPQ